MPKLIDYTGRKFHYLTLITRARSGGAGVGAVWLAQCICGNTREVIAKEARAGRIKSCGKCQSGRDLARVGRMRTDRSSKEERRAYLRHIRAALRSGRKFEITAGQVLDLIRTKCSYCGSPPTESNKGLNDIDLIVDSEGYALGNILPICQPCQKLKGSLNVRSFLEHIRKIARYIDPTNK